MSAANHRPLNWPLVAAAATLGASLAALVFHYAPQSERYDQFTVGAIAWTAAPKTRDYLLLFTLIGATGGAWIALAALRHRVERTRGASDAHAFASILGFSSLLAIAWSGANLFGPRLTLDLVYLSAEAVTLCVAASLLLLRLKVRPFGDALAFVMTGGLCGALFLPVLGVAVNRVAAMGAAAIVWHGVPGTMWLMPIGAVIAAGIAIALVRHVGCDRGRHLLGVLQLPWPWAFLIVLPWPWGSPTGVTELYPGQGLPAAVLVLVAMASADLARRWFGTTRTGESQWMRIVSPLCLAAVIGLLRIGVPPPAYVSRDDYHFGEALLPWWSWSQHGMVPYRDYVPARGMVNYLPGVVASLFGDGSAAMIAASGPVVMAALFAALMAATAPITGALQAAALYLLFPFSDRVTDIEPALTVLLMLGWYHFARTSATRWSIGWLMAVLPAFLFAPGQALLMTAATAPLFVWQLGRALLDEPARARRALLIFAVALIALLLVTPLGSMLVGAWRYVAEHSAVASVAHGIDWPASLDRQGAANYWLSEAIRTSFAAVPIAAIVLLAVPLWRRDWSEAGRVAVVALPILVLGLLYIPRVASRIDPGSASRLGLTSAWMYSMLLPVLLATAWGRRAWPTILACAFFVLGALAFMLGGMIYPGAFELRALPIGAKPVTILDGAALGIPSLGRADVDAADAGRLLRVRRTLDALLEPDETYLDLTNRNAHYFYFNRRLTIESGALYNLPNEVQQLRAIRRLDAARVPVVLASADTIVHDGGPASLRGHGLYRYVVQRYQPVRITNDVYLVRPDRMARALGLATSNANTDPFALLDEAFAPPPLKRIPTAWGKSWDHLQHDAVFVQALETSVSGDFTLAPVAGRDAGLLVMETNCAAVNASVPAMSVQWAGEVPGGVLNFEAGPRVVVPLDAAPRWLLAKSIRTLSVRTSDPVACPLSAITRVELWQRRIASQIDPR